MIEYELLNDKFINISGFDEEEQGFIKELLRLSKLSGTSYFDLLRLVKCPGAFPLRGGKQLTKEIICSPFYKVAHDIADRCGIKEGYLLDPRTNDGPETNQKDE